MSPMSQSSNIHLNITLPSTTRSPFPIGFLSKTCLIYLSHACYLYYPSELLDLIILVIFG
jgi:hypothetical protein